MIRQSNSNMYVYMHVCIVYVCGVCMCVHVCCTPEAAGMLNRHSGKSVDSLVPSTGTEMGNYLSTFCDLVGLVKYRVFSECLTSLTFHSSSAKKYSVFFSLFFFQINKRG